MVEATSNALYPFSVVVSGAIMSVSIHFSIADLENSILRPVGNKVYAVRLLIFAVLFAIFLGTRTRPVRSLRTRYR